MQSSRMRDVDRGKSGLQNGKRDKPQGNPHRHREQTGRCTADLVLRTLNLGFRKKRKGEKSGYKAITKEKQGSVR